MIANINSILTGWHGHFQYSYRATFGIANGWVRRRLPSIPRRQQRKRWIAKTHGADETRWPNAFFTKHELFSLQAAREVVSQSSRS